MAQGVSQVCAVYSASYGGDSIGQGLLSSWGPSTTRRVELLGLLRRALGRTFECAGGFSLFMIRWDESPKTKAGGPIYLGRRTAEVAVPT